MGELRFTLKFFGGKADEHRVSANRLADILRSIGSDIQNVCHIIAADDVNTDVSEIARGCKLYVVGTPKESSLEIPIATNPTENKWPVVAGRTYVSALQELPSENGDLPKGINRTILEHVLSYSYDAEYEGLQLTVLGNGDGEPEKTVIFDYKLRAVAQRKLAELPTIGGAATIYGHTVTGIMYGLEDQNYSDPSASITVEVDPGAGKRWMCRIPKEKIPDDLAEHWKERVMVHGIATFKPRKPEMEVNEIRFLGPEPDPDEALEHFIKINQAVWQGVNINEYLDYVRERD